MSPGARGLLLASAILACYPLLRYRHPSGNGTPRHVVGFARALLLVFLIDILLLPALLERVARAGLEGRLILFAAGVVAADLSVRRDTVALVVLAVAAWRSSGRLTVPSRAA